MPAPISPLIGRRSVPSILDELLARRRPIEEGRDAPKFSEQITISNLHCIRRAALIRLKSCRADRLVPRAEVIDKRRERREGIVGGEIVNHWAAIQLLGEGGEQRTEVVVRIASRLQASGGKSLVSRAKPGLISGHTRRAIMSVHLGSGRRVAQLVRNGGQRIEQIDIVQVRFNGLHHESTDHHDQERSDDDTPKPALPPAPPAGNASRSEDESNADDGYEQYEHAVHDIEERTHIC